MSSVDDLSCQELVELVTDYLKDALPPAERARSKCTMRQTTTGCSRRYSVLINLRLHSHSAALFTLSTNTLIPILTMHAYDSPPEKLVTLFREWRPEEP